MKTFGLSGCFFAHDTTKRNDATARYFVVIPKHGKRDKNWILRRTSEDCPFSRKPFLPSSRGITSYMLCIHFSSQGVQCMSLTLYEIATWPPCVINAGSRETWSPCIISGGSRGGARGGELVILGKKRMIEGRIAGRARGK